MPNRIVREGLVESEAVNTLSCEGERFFSRLLLKADDYGRYHAHPQLLKAHLFPLKPEITVGDISRWVAECQKADIVWAYEADGKRYLCIPKFRQRLRLKNPSKFPAPPRQTHPCHVPNARPADDGHASDVCPTYDADATDTRPPEAGSESEKCKREERSESGKRNAPTLEEALAYFAKLPEADYTADEVKICWLSFEANKDQFGQWYWGRRLVGDWRAAMESRMADARSKPGRAKNPPESNQRHEKIDPPSSL
jgi:hypothetical protein